jgi:hypothetical protein
MIEQKVQTNGTFNEKFRRPEMKIKQGRFSKVANCKFETETAKVAFFL